MKLNDVYAAHKRIGGWIRRTPLEHSPILSELFGCDVWLKLENRQLTGSFKIRGAANRLMLLKPEERGRGSSPPPPGTTPRVSPTQPEGSASGPSSSCPRTRRR